MFLPGRARRRLVLTTQRTLTKESILNQAQLTIRTATDILDVVPTLLGFIPTESLVIIYLDTVNARDRVAMTARMDLPIGPNEFTAALQIIEQHAHRTTRSCWWPTAWTLPRRPHPARDAQHHHRIEIKVAISASAEGWAEVEVDEPIHRHPYPDKTSVVATAMVAARHPILRLPCKLGQRRVR